MPRLLGLLQRLQTDKELPAAVLTNVPLLRLGALHQCFLGQPGLLHGFFQSHSLNAAPTLSAPGSAELPASYADNLMGFDRDLGRSVQGWRTSQSLCPVSDPAIDCRPHLVLDFDLCLQAIHSHQVACPRLGLRPQVSLRRHEIVINCLPHRFDHRSPPEPSGSCLAGMLNVLKNP